MSKLAKLKLQEEHCVADNLGDVKIKIKMKLYHGPIPEVLILRSYPPFYASGLLTLSYTGTAEAVMRDILNSFWTLEQRSQSLENI